MKCNTVYVLPHPPELFSFYKDSDTAKAAEKTVSAYDCILDEIKAEEPEVIVFIQSLGGIVPQGITIQTPQDDEYSADHTAFVFNKSETKVPDPFQIEFDKPLASQIQKSLSHFEKSTEIMELSQIPLSVLIFLDLYKHKIDSLPKIIVLGVSLEGPQRHYEYGSLIARALASDQENSVVVASGQLSHRLIKNSPGSYSPAAKDFDLDFMNYLEKGRLDQFMAIDPFVIDDVAEDLYKVMCTSLGVINALKDPYKFEKYSYEAPQGVGYLVGKLVST